MKWLSISLIMLCLVACRSKQTTISEQKTESMQLHGAHGVTIFDYFCSDSMPLLLNIDTVHPFRNLAKAQHKKQINPHHERLILTTYTTDTQRVSCSQSQEKVVVTKDRLFSFSYDDFVVIVLIVLGVGLFLKSYR